MRSALATWLRAAADWLSPLPRLPSSSNDIKLRIDAHTRVVFHCPIYAPRPHPVYLFPGDVLELTDGNPVPYYRES